MITDMVPTSPLRKLIERSQVEDQFTEAYQTASKKLTEAAWRFDRETDGKFLKTLELHQIDKELFRRRLKTGMNCHLTRAELDALLPLFENEGAVDGYEFVITFYHLRFEYKGMVDRKLVEHNRRFREAAIAEVEKQQEKFVEKYAVKLKASTTEDDLASAVSKLADAAMKYDSMAQGAIPLDAFQCVSMRPEELRNQLKILFNIKYTVRELSALVRQLNKGSDDDSIRCADFLVFFVRLGFQERSRHNQERWEMEKRKKDLEEKRRELESEKQAKKFLLRVKGNFAPADTESALLKLREAARLYDIQIDQKRALRGFECAFMPLHIFRDQLKINWNITLSPTELAALIDKFNDGDGNIQCDLFVKNFLTFMSEERDKEVRDVNERQKKAEEQRKLEQLRVEDEKAAKNAKKVNFKYSDEDMASAMTKLKEAAYRFDRNMPGAPSLAAFASTSISAFDFKEQLKRLFNMFVTPRELGALMVFFRADEQGNIACATFLMMFLKIGFDERQDRTNLYRKQEADLAEWRTKEALSKAKQAEAKLVLRVKGFTEEEYESAMTKLSEAALQYDRSSPGAMGLGGFQGVSMPPNVFREQIKRVFGLNVTMGELGALVSFFDRNNTGSGVVNCKEFIDKFLRMGMAERDKLTKSKGDQQRLKEQKELAKEKAREEEERLRASRSVNFQFSELEFDTALTRFIATCHHFNPQTLGPMGWASITADRLPFSEFKALLKLQFQMRFTPAEFGALVMFCDPSFQAKGYVSCRSFINVFLQTKLHSEQFKSRPDESALLKAYQEQLKDAYQIRLQRVRERADMEGLSSDSLTRPWRAKRANSLSPPRHIGGGESGVDREGRQEGAVSTNVSRPVSGGGAVGRSNRGGVISSIKRQKLSKPMEAVSKLKLRLTVGRDIGRMDLSTKICWPEEDDEMIRSSSLSPESGGPGRGWVGAGGLGGPMSRSQEVLFTERSVEYGLTGVPPRVSSSRQSRRNSSRVSRSVTPYGQIRPTDNNNNNNNNNNNQNKSETDHGFFPPQQGANALSGKEMTDLLTSAIFDQSTISEGGIIGDSAFDSPKNVSKHQSSSQVDRSSNNDNDLAISEDEDMDNANMADYLGEDFVQQPSITNTNNNGAGAGTSQSASSFSNGVGSGENSSLLHGSNSVKKVKNYVIPLDTVHNGYQFTTTKTGAAKGGGNGALGGSSLLLRRATVGEDGVTVIVNDDLANDAMSLASTSQSKKKGNAPLEEGSIAKSINSKKAEEKRVSAHLALGARLESGFSVEFTLAEIPTQVFSFVHLTELWLCNNLITIIPGDIGSLKQLKTLSVTNNFVEVLPDEICTLSKLERLYLGGNRLSSLPTVFQFLGELLELDLKDNDFESFPDVICSLKPLRSLDMSGNRISSLPMSLKSLKHLTCLFAWNTDIIEAPPVVPLLHWCVVVGCPVANGQGLGIQAKGQGLTSTTENDYLDNRHDDHHLHHSSFSNQMEGFLRHRASSRITARLRRRKKNNLAIGSNAAPITHT